MINNFVENQGINEEEVQRVRDESPHYHAGYKGCEIEILTRVLKSKDGEETHIPKGQKCKTHNVELCRCLWEVMMHGGEDMRKFWKNQNG